MGSFDTLPYELFLLILANLSFESLRRVSLINRRSRVATTPILFRVVKFDFSGPGLEGLQQLARSHIAGYVTELHYEALPLVNPCTWSPRADLCPDDRQTSAIRTTSPHIYKLHKSMKETFVT